MEQAQAGGLIDKYWFLNWIIIPLILIGSTYGFFWFIDYNCPYVEDVSSCFPWNLPDWFVFSLPFILLALIIFWIWLHLRTPGCIGLP